MKPLSLDASASDVINALEAIQLKNPYRYEVKAMQFHDVHYHGTVTGISLKAKDSKSDAIGYRNPAHHSDDVKKNQEFIERLNEFITSEFPPVIDWDRRFLKMAAGEINTWSKDPSTKVSATIFRGKYPIAAAYNGFPPGIADTPERLNNRELKYKLVQHAEANAISTCSKLGISTEGATMAVTHFPCSTCAGLMIGAGIKKVVVQKPNEDFLSRWKDSVELSKDMFTEAGVELVVIDLNDD